jgi:hypothetical protein
VSQLNLLFLQVACRLTSDSASSDAGGEVFRGGGSAAAPLNYSAQPAAAPLN